MNLVRPGLLAILTLFYVFSLQPLRASDLKAVLASYEDDPHKDLHSVVVTKNGVILAEHYYNGGDQDTLVDVRSVGKSVTALVFGIAMEQGSIKSVDDPVSTYWPQAAKHAAGPIPLKDLLTMRSGLNADDGDSQSPGNENRMDASDDTLAFTLAVPRLEASGTRFVYSSLAAFITGVVIWQATDTNMEDYARKHLFSPLGITRLDWQEDVSGITKGQGNLFLTTPGLAAIGTLVLNNGSYQGKQVVSKAWIEEILKQKVDISNDVSFASHYGYYWYHQEYTVNGRTIVGKLATGNGGNKIHIFPELNTVVTIMSRAYGQRHGHRRSDKILKEILPLL